jgi:hypothetical protein
MFELLCFSLVHKINKFGSFSVVEYRAQALRPRTNATCGVFIKTAHLFLRLRRAESGRTQLSLIDIARLHNARRRLAIANKLDVLYLLALTVE